MDAVFVRNGESIDYTPSGVVRAGDVVVLNTLVGVAKEPIAANTLGSLATEGVFWFPKLSTGGGEDLDQGEDCYWDSGTGIATTDDGSGTYPYLGKCWYDAGVTAERVQVKLLPCDPGCATGTGGPT